MKTDFRGFFKPKKRGQWFGYNWWQRIIMRIVKLIQKTLWLCGIALYDPIFGECTPDFNCCHNIGRKRWLHWHPKEKNNV